MRTKPHVIDSQAIALINMKVPAKDWTVHTIGERGYGNDLMIQLFKNESATGGCFFVQSKDTEADFNYSIQIPNFPRQNHRVCFVI